MVMKILILLFFFEISVPWMAILLNVVEHGKDVIIIILKLKNQFAWLQCTINCLS